MLRRLQSMPDEKKDAFARTVAGLITLCVLAVWAVAFSYRISGEPAAAVGAVSEPGIMGGMFEQIGTLISETRSAFSEPAPSIEESFDPAL